MTEALKNEDGHIHNCEEQPSGITIGLNDEYLDRPDPIWCLFIERHATEDDLEQNHYLNEVGETIWTTIVEIKFCPYCGRKLVSETSSDTVGFVHIDSSGRTSRKL